MVELTPSQKASARFLNMTDEEYAEYDRLIDLGRDTLLSVRTTLIDAIEQMGDKRPGRFSAHLDEVLETVDNGLLCGDCGARPDEHHVPGCDVERCKLCGWQAIDCDCRDPEGEQDISTTWTGLWPGEAERREYGYRDLNELAVACARGELTWDRDKERWVRP